MGYASLLIKATFYPQRFWAKQAPKLKQSATWQFLIITLVLEHLLSIIVNLLQSQKLSLMFVKVSELIFIIPLSVVGAVIFTMVIYFIARAQGGRANFHQTLMAVIFSSGPMILLLMDRIGNLALGYQILLLIYALNQVHKFNFLKALTTVLIPALVILVAARSLGLWQS